MPLVASLGALIVAMLATTLAFGTTLVDLTSAHATATIDGAIYTQGQSVPVSGTGVLNPFLRSSVNGDVERGIATDYDPKGQDPALLNNDANWTKALRLSNVPVIKVGATNYREFILDINQIDSNPKWFLSLDELKIFLTGTPNITSYTDGGLTGGGTLNGVAYTAGSGIGHMVFSQGDNVIKLNYDLAAGSGKPDLTVLIPDSVFSGADYCAYAQTGCNTWMGFYAQYGGWNGTDISGTNSLYPNNDGFEEWSTIIRPVVNVTKTATATSGTHCTWDIDKDVDKTEIDIADGGTATFNYTVDVTHDCSTTANPVTGNIVITNPATLPDGTATAPATVTSVTDVFTPGDVSGTVTCPGGLPHTLTSGQSLTCTYSLDVSTNGTNTATVMLSDSSVAPATATAAVNFVNTVTDGTVTVVDDKTDPSNPVTLGTVTYTDPSPTTFTYSLTKSGVAGTCTDYDNTATFTTNDTQTTDSDDQTVTVCVGKDLTVTKTATPTFTRTYEWGITKDVDQTRVDIAEGGTATFNYTVSVTHDSGTDSAWATSGTITVTNPNDWEDITFDLADVVDNGGTCTITGGGTSLTVAADDSVIKAYTCTWASAPSAASGTNTATATWDKDVYATPDGTASGTKTFTFGTPTTLIDESVTVVDDKTDPSNPVTLGTVTYTDPSPTTFTYSLTKSGVAGTCTDYDNTATFTTNDTQTTDSDDQTVTVCVGKNLTVSKTATPAFGRTFTWGITKDVDKTEIDIAEGGTATFNYTVSVTHDSGSDSGWTATGTITVTNPNDWEDITVDITDAVDNGGTCVVTDGTDVVVPKDDSVTRDYTCTWVSEPAEAAGVNSATATWDKDAAHTPNDSASGTANFTFNNPETLTDESVNVTDTNAVSATNPTGFLGTVTYTDASPKTFTYSVDRTGVAGTCTDYDNRATFVTNDTGTTDDADQSVTVCVGKDLTVSKTATPAFTRTYEWDIAKDVDQTSVTISNGQSATFNYTVSVTHDSGTDSGWTATGTITVTNPNDWEDVTVDITDAVDNGGTCVVTDGTDVVVPKDDSVTRDYTCSWASAPSAGSGTNTATATWDKDAAHTPNDSASGTAAFAFSTPTGVDESVTVTDTYAGTLGTVSVSDPSPTTFTYSRTVTPDDYGNVCGTTSYDNTATFTTNDTSTTGSADQEVEVTVESCGVPGKTLGFWGNKNGHKVLDPDGNGMLNTSVTIGSGSHTFTVTTIRQSDKILNNDDCAGGSPAIFSCSGNSGLVKGLNKNSFEVLGAQTLALTYNIGNIDGYGGQSISTLGCSDNVTDALVGLGLSSSSSVDEVLTAANDLIGNSFKPSGTATQAQVGAMNSLLGCLNRETL